MHWLVLNRTFSAISQIDEDSLDVCHGHAVPVLEAVRHGRVTVVAICITTDAQVPLAHVRGVVALLQQYLAGYRTGEGGVSRVGDYT